MTDNGENAEVREALVERIQQRLIAALHALHSGGQGSVRGWANDIADNALDVLNKVEQPRAATADVDPQDAAASLGELSLPAKDGAGLPRFASTYWQHCKGKRKLLRTRPKLAGRPMGDQLPTECHHGAGCSIGATLESTERYQRLHLGDLPRFAWLRAVTLRPRRRGTLRLPVATPRSLAWWQVQVGMACSA